MLPGWSTARRLRRCFDRTLTPAAFASTRRFAARLPARRGTSGSVTRPRRACAATRMFRAGRELPSGAVVRHGRELRLVDWNEHGIGRRWTCDHRFLTGGLHGQQPCPATPWVRPPPAVFERFVPRPVSPVPAHPTFVRRPVLNRRREGVGQDGDNRGNGRPDRNTYPSTEHPADGSGDEHGKHGVEHGRMRALRRSPVRTGSREVRPAHVEGEPKVARIP